MKLARTVEFTYDGNGTHREKAETYNYDDSTGNLTQTVSWGEVTGSNNGTFTDTGTDVYTTTIAYASGSSRGVTGLPSQETTTDQSGNKIKATRYYYDELSLDVVDRGNVTREEHWIAGADYSHTTKTYDSFGLVAEERDPRDYITSYTYDEFNLYPATITNALNQQTQFQYDYASGKITQKIDPNGRIFQTAYDGLGRVIEERQPDLNTPAQLVLRTSYAYTDAGFGSSVRRSDYQDGSTHPTTYIYFDGFGRVIQTRKQAEAANTFAVADVRYNSLGLVQQQALPYFAAGTTLSVPTTEPTLYTTFTYDALRRVVNTATAVGMTTNVYDDWRLSLTDANGKQKDLYKDAYDRIVQVAEHNGGSVYTTKYAYDGLGDLIKLTDANGNIRNFAYDGLGRRTIAEDLHVPADATFGMWTCNYDDSGNLVSRVDGNDQKIGFEYDALNRMTIETADDGKVAFSYDTCPDGVGRLCTVQSDNLVQTNEYDALGSIKVEHKTIDETEYQTTYTYDRLGHLLSIVNPDNAEVRYLYNPAGLLEQVQLKEAGAHSYTNVITGIDYNPLGRIASLVYANGAVTTNTYDPAKLYRLQRKATLLPVAGGNARPVQDLNYTYDNVGNILQIVDNSDTDTRKTSSYAYDDLYRLIAVNVASGSNQQFYSEAYSYDPVGNISTKSGPGYNWSYSYAGNLKADYANPHAVTAIGQRFFQTLYLYDRNGNLSGIKGSASFTWDHNNRLTQSVISGVANSYAYDPSGQRIKSVNYATTTLYPSKFYNISRATILPTGRTSKAASSKLTRPSGPVSVKHIFIGDDIVATVTSSGSEAVVHLVHTDHLTGANIITNSNAQLEEVTDYYPFGAIRLDEQLSGFSEQRKFAGHEYDVNTGLSYMDARYYNGGIGRFLSQDPAFLAVGHNSQIKQVTGQELQQYLGDPQNMNSYAYGRNNPLVYNDPTGQFSFNPLGFLSYNTQVTIGNWANNAYANNSVARYALDHPYQAGAAIGVAGGALVAGGVVAAGGSITCGILCGTTAATVATTGGTAAATQSDKVIQSSELAGSGIQIGQSFGKLGTVINNSPGMVTGFTAHGLDQAVSREVATQTILETTRNPLVVLRQAGETTLYLSDKAAVVLNNAGRVVTTYGNNLFRPDVINIIKAVKR